MSTVVLFNHPGEEHVCRQAGTFPWNVGEHRRKYVEVEANVARGDGSAFRRAFDKQRVGLWAEFEPDTNCRPLSASEPRRRDLPVSCHTLLPIAVVPDDGQNTDPWIFGETFRYGFCRQVAARTSFLRNLVHGDLLLFGSFMMLNEKAEATSHYNFFVDTVFVVDAGYPWRRRDRVPSRLLDASYQRAAASRFDPKQLKSCTLYEGVMLTDERSTQPFSFAPCRPSPTSGPEPMARPLVSDLLDFKTNNPREVPKFERDARKLWREIVARCRSVGSELAVRVEDPGVKDAGESGRTRTC
jgi:hypothetical protein